MRKNSLYPPIEPYSTGFLEVDDIHTLYWEQCGNPDGVPILFLHGGPGSGAVEMHRRFFDPEHYRIIIFDQRGAGRSTPLAELKGNTRENLVKDIEKIRKHLKIDKWHILGGSWGATLALSYAIKHPENIMSIIIYATFLLEQSEIDWWLYGIRTVFPEAWEEFSAHVGHEEDLHKAYYERLTGDDGEVARSAGVAWSRYENSCMCFIPQSGVLTHREQEDTALAVAKIEAHYYKNETIEKDNSILNHIDKIRKIPATIIQGRYDMVCPVKTANELHKAWPEADYIIVKDGGHTSMETQISSRLIEATNNMRAI